MRCLKLFPILALAAIGLTSCKGGRASIEEKPAGPGSLKTAACVADTSQHYMLFEPEGYPGDKQWPVIFCFDPHADGKLAIEKFIDFARENGYLLIGSNNAKNGLSTMEYAVKTLYDDVLSHCRLDQKRIYMAGFSGGGRVALSLGFGWPGIQGVITCGAGTPGFQPATAMGKPAIFALAGDGDFNFPEVENMPQQFDGSGIPVFARIFHGTHAWPPPSELTRAMEWMHLEAMKKGLIDEQKSLAEKWLAEIADTAVLFEKLHEPLEALKLYQLGASMAQGLVSEKKFKQEAERLQNTEELRSYSTELGKISLLENKAREEYGRAITEKDTAWWRKEINGLNKHLSANEKPEWKALYNRIFGYMSILAYTYSNRSLQNGDLSAARHFVSIYGIIDPENPDYLRFKKAAGL